MGACRCVEHGVSGGGTQLGGEEVTQATTAVFAALVWHTQALREDLQKYGTHVTPNTEENRQECVVLLEVKDVYIL